LTTTTFSIDIQAGHPYVEKGIGKVRKEGIPAKSMRGLLIALGIMEEGDLLNIAVDGYPVKIKVAREY